MEPGTFTCSICGEDSRDICVYCTKDACGNHLCERCRRCSDCCECVVPMGKSGRESSATISEVDLTTEAPCAPAHFDHS